MIERWRPGPPVSRHDDHAHDRKKAEHKKARDDALDAGLEDSFPGSDPVAVAQPPPRSPRDKNRP